MSEETTQQEEAPVEPLAVVPPKDKPELYRQIADRLNAAVDSKFTPVQERVKTAKNMDIQMRKVFGDQDSRDLVVQVLDGMFDILLTPNAEGQPVEGSVGIPGGFGSLQLGTAAATIKKTPQGVEVNVPKRWRIKYSPGKIVDEKLAELDPPPATEATAEVTTETPA